MFKIYRFRREAPHDAPLDSHAEGQAFVLTEGAIRFRLAERTWVLTPGRLCWIPPHVSHGFTAHGPVAGISLKVIARDLPDHSCVLAADPFYLAVLERLMARPDTAALLWGGLADAIRESSIVPADHVLLLEHMRDRLGLDFGRLGVAGIRNGGRNLGAEPEP